MELHKPYINIADTMRCLLIQVKDSIKFADQWLPGNINGSDLPYLWDILKSNTVFVHDPIDTELLQTMQTLMINNYWRIPGAGDCDCFVITVTACCIVLGIPCKIVLAGRDNRIPVHIYNKVKDTQGNWITFDLTNDFLGEERNYPYTQNINLK